MKHLYALCGISKQAHYRMLRRVEEWKVKESFYVGLMLQIREIHPAMGLRTMTIINQKESEEMPLLASDSTMAFE